MVVNIVEAYPLYLVYTTKTVDSLNKALIRILDLSPSAKIKIYDYPLKAIAKALSSGTITVDGLTCESGKAEDTKYFGKKIDLAIPNNHYYESRQNTYILRAFIDDKSYKLSVIIADINGRIDKIEVDRNSVGGLIERSTNKLNKRLMLEIKNLAFTVGNYGINTSSEVDGLPRMFRVSLDRELFSLDAKTLGIRASVGETVFDGFYANDIIKPTSEFTDNTSWIKKLANSNGETRLGDLPELAIPEGVAYLDRLSADKGEIKATKITLPSSLITIREGCFSRAKNIREIVFNPKRPGENLYYNKIHLNGLDELYKSGNLPLVPMAPKMINSIHELFTFGKNDIIFDVSADLSGIRTLETLADSYSYVRIKDRVLFPKALSTITKCFVNVLDIGEVTIPCSVQNIDNSFIFGGDPKASCDYQGGKESQKVYMTYELSKLSLEFGSELQYITSSFLSCAFEDLDLSSCNNLRNIDNCFNSCINLKHIKFPDNAARLSTLSRSFNNIGAEVVDLSNLTSITKLGSCFNNCKNLRKVILPKSDYGWLISDSFRNCPNLVEIENLRYARNLVDYSFYGCGIHKIELDSDLIIDKAFSPGDTIIAVGNTLSSCPRGKDYKVIISDEIKSLGISAFSGLDIDNIDIKCKPSSLGNCCFKSAKGTVLDMYNWPIETIPTYCFENCAINVVILPKTTKKFMSYAFKDCKWKAVLLPDKVEDLDNTSLLDSFNELTGTTIYTTRGNPLLRRVRQKSYIIKEYSSLDEAYQAIQNEFDTSSAKDMLKMKLVLNSSENSILKEFTDDKYLPNSKLMYDMYSKLGTLSDEAREKIKIDLDTSKYSIIGNLSDLLSYMDGYGDLFTVPNTENTFASGFLSERYIKKVSTDLLKNQFSLISNIITKFTKPCSFLTDLGKFVSLFETIRLSTQTPSGVSRLKPCRTRVIYKDWVSSIFSIILNCRQGLLSYYNIELIMISIGGRIVYVTSRTTGKYDDSDRDIPESIYNVFLPLVGELCDIVINCDEKHNLIQDVLRPGFKLVCKSRYDMLGAIELAPKLSKAIEEVFLDNTCFIGADKVVDRKADMLLMSYLDGTFVKVKCIGIGRKLYSKEPMETFSSIIVEEIYPFNELPSKYNKMIARQFCNDASNLINQAVDSDGFKDKIRNVPGAYDDFEPCVEWVLSKELRNANISDISSLNSKVINLIFSTIFFSKKYIKAEKLMERPIRRDRKYTTSDGRTLICAPVSSKKLSRLKMFGVIPRYMCFYEDDLNNKSNVDCYMCAVEFSEIFYAILDVYSNDENLHVIREVNNEIYSVDDFAFIFSNPELYNGWSISTAIAKKTGYCYMIAARDYGISAILLFRIKRSADCGVLSCEMSKLSGNKLSEIIRRDDLVGLGGLANSIYKPGGQVNWNYYDIVGLRESMLNGLANGEITYKKLLEFEKLIAKQPR